MGNTLLELHVLSPDSPLAWMATIALRATVILALAGLLAGALRRAPAALRHALWAAALVSVLVLPLLVILPGWRVIPVPSQPSLTLRPDTPAAAPDNVQPPAESTIAQDMPGATSAVSEPLSVEPVTVPAQPVDAFSESAVERDAAPIQPAAPALPPANAIAWATLILVTWAAGASIMLLPALAAAWLLRRIDRHARPLSDPNAQKALEEGQVAAGIQGEVLLQESPRCRVPMTFGIRHPRILVPASSSHWSTSQWHMILAHELAHIRRHDLVTMRLAQLARALYWFHPLAWLACQQLSVESEKACDDAVVRAGIRPTEYAAALVDIAASSQRSLLRHAVLHMARQSTLESRIRRVLDGNCRRGATLRTTLAMLTIVVGLSATIGLLRPAPAQTAATAAPAVAPTEPTPAQKAAQAMLKAALDARQGIKETEEAHAKTPDFLDLRLAVERQVLNAQELLATSPAERRDALQNYQSALKQITHTFLQAGEVSPTLQATSDYAMAEADFLLAAEGAKSNPPDEDAEERMKSAELAMLGAAKDEAAIQFHREPPDAAFEAMFRKSTALLRALRASLLLFPTGRERAQAVNDYLRESDKLAEIHDTIMIYHASQGRNIDEEPWAMRMHYALYLLHYLGEAELVLQPETANDQVRLDEARNRMRQFAERMVDRAERELHGLDVLNAAQTPELVMTKIVASKRLLDGQLACDLRSPAWQDHLKRMTDLRAFLADRRDPPASKAALALVDYAIADAQYRLTSTPATAPASAPAPKAPALTPAQTAAAQAMLQAALNERQGMLDIADIRQKNPEFWEAWLAPEYHILTARLLLHPAGPDRRAALQEYLDAATKMNQEVEKRIDTDATHASVARSRYVLAEAQHFLAEDGAKQSPAEPGAADKAQSAAEAMLKFALEELAGIREIEAVRTKSPEFVELRVGAQRRILDCQLLVNPARENRRQALQEYLAAIAEYDKLITARVGLDVTKVSLGRAHNALAEAQYLLACEDASDQGMKSAAAAMLKAAELEQQAIADIDPIRAKSAEWLLVKIAASHRLASAQLLVNRNGPARQEHLDRMLALRNLLESRINLDATKASLAAADYAVAEAQFQVASEPPTAGTSSPATAPGASTRASAPATAPTLLPIAVDDKALVDVMAELVRTAQIDPVKVSFGSNSRQKPVWHASVSLDTDEAHLLRFLDEFDKCKWAARPAALHATWSQPGAENVHADIPMVVNDPDALAKVPRVAELVRDVLTARTLVPNQPALLAIATIPQSGEWEIAALATAPDTPDSFIKALARRDHFLTASAKLPAAAVNRVSPFQFTVALTQRPSGSGMAMTAPAPAPATALSRAASTEANATRPATTGPAAIATHFTPLTRAQFSDKLPSLIISSARSSGVALPDVTYGMVNLRSDSMLAAVLATHLDPGQAVLLIDALETTDLPLRPSTVNLTRASDGTLTLELRVACNDPNLLAQPPHVAKCIRTLFNLASAVSVSSLTTTDGSQWELVATAATDQAPRDLTRTMSQDPQFQKVTLKTLVYDKQNSQFKFTLAFSYNPAPPATKPTSPASTPATLTADKEAAPNVPGEIYIMGEVTRPGVYSANGSPAYRLDVNRRTLKQALVAAGLKQQDLPLLWATLLRRTENPDFPESMSHIHVGALFDGTAPDRALQTYDIIRVDRGATLEIHAVADGSDAGPAGGLPDPNNPGLILQVKAEVLLDTSALASAALSQSQDHPGIDITFTDQGSRRFAEITRAHLRRQLAFRINGVLVCAPVIQSVIDSGKAQITFGPRTPPETIKSLADALQSAIDSRKPPITAPATAPATRR